MGGRYETISKPFADAPQYEQDSFRKTTVWTMRRRAQMGEDHATMMTGIADKYHGQPVRVIEQAPPAAAIMPGQKKVFESGFVATVDYVQGARVYWKGVRGDRVVRSWTGTQAWRKMADA